MPEQNGTHDRHAYLKKHPRNFGNEFTVISVPEDQVEDAQYEGWTRLTRDEALNEARSHNHPDQQAYISVIPCSCDGCALMEYARKHRWSILAKRVPWERVH